MKSQNPHESFEKFRLDRQRPSDGSDDPSVDFSQIDDMLDRIDTIFQNREDMPMDVDCHEQEQAAIIKSELGAIMEHLAVLETTNLAGHLAVHFAEFCARTRIKVCELLELTAGLDTRVQAGFEIEFEIDYVRLHEFMLCPHLATLAAAS